MNNAELYIGMRKKMVQQLQQKFQYGREVLEAMNAVPRHLFIEKGMEHLAYEDKPLPIAAGQTISQPSTVALQTHLSGIKKWDKVLEIGTGCGYQTAVLAQLGARVYSIERQRELYLAAQKNLARMGYDKPLLFFGDGYKGLPQFAPFKAIIVTCGAQQLPQELLLQLEIGGRMVIPIGEEKQQQTLAVIERIGENEFNKTTHGKCSFVPMLEGTNK
ncbi:MAG: protein-L-isoaspartate(D-aspartate) O-methyltransferase [Bacteroidales bacterium]|nr:protein-L-isoaspartate(D-aspartate) O-methyltransferase [Bacteroidales bacterium]